MNTYVQGRWKRIDLFDGIEAFYDLLTAEIADEYIYFRVDEAWAWNDMGKMYRVEEVEIYNNKCKAISDGSRVCVIDVNTNKEAAMEILSEYFSHDKEFDGRFHIMGWN